MAFTVEDFHDLVELLAQRPEWRAELRRLVLSDDLLELPALVRELVEAQRRSDERLASLERTVQALAEAQVRTEAQLAELTAAQTRTDERLAELTEAQTRTEARLGELTEAQIRFEHRLDRVEDRLGSVEGDVLELRYAQRAPAYFGPIARRLRVIESGPLADLLDDAIDDGRLTEAERQAILLADLVLSGRRRLNGEDVYLLAEISAGIGLHDVERAVERARLLEKLGRPVLPVVAGRRIDGDAAQLAHARGVWYVIGGRVVPPRSD